MLAHPGVVFEETFENGRSTPQTLENYPGTNGVRYTASAYWRDTGYCNGIITSALPNLTIDQIRWTYCGLNGDPADQRRSDYNAVRVKAQALGIFAGNNGNTNRALSTGTSGGRPDSVMFRTQSDTIQLPTTSQNRFYAFSVDAAITYDLAEQNGPPKPEMYFYLTRNGQDLRLNTQALAVGTGQQFNFTGQNPVNSSLAWASQGTVGRYYSSPFLLSPDPPT